MVSKERTFRDKIETLTEDKKELYKNLDDNQEKLFHDAIAGVRAEGQAEGRAQGQAEERRRGVCY
jgi:hypothetical protein